MLSDETAYRQLVKTLKAAGKPVTAADVTARSALPLEQVKALLPRAADEFSAALEVTESGEICYSFPRGFSSRYTGAAARWKRFCHAAGTGLKAALSLFFKIWIMAMLVGYFALFVLIALAALFFLVAASSSGKNRRNNRDDDGGGINFSGLLNGLFRFWFYSNVFGGQSYRRSGRAAEPGVPLYKQVFSFVFGDGDPNAGWDQKLGRVLIAYIRSHRGVISLPEFIALSGLGPAEADKALLSACVKYGGSPEASDEGTVVYRFDEILLGEAEAGGRLPGPEKARWKFSSNKSSSNAAFALINAVNLGFGAYFLYFALNSQAAAGSDIAYLFLFVYSVLYNAGVTSFVPIGAGLGIVPLLFSFLFWLIPALRNAGLESKNRRIEKENRRKKTAAAIWKNPLEARAALGEDLIVELGTYSQPEVTVDEQGAAYSFRELLREKTALENYRAQVKVRELGNTVFSSED
jgi:hypothetical protein